MSDNFKIIAVGGAGINTTKDLRFENQLSIYSSKFGSIEEVREFVNSSINTDKSVVISSPAGEFSSLVLPTVCNTLHSRGEKIFLISIMPFLSESPDRKRRGERVLKNLKKSVDTTVIIENENFASVMMERSITEMFKKINHYIGLLVKDFISIADNIPDSKTVGLFRAEGSSLEELEKNIIFTSSMKSEGMMGIANVRNQEECVKLLEYFPVDIMYSRTGANLTISGVTLPDSLVDSYSPELPSEPCFHKGL